MREIVQGKVKAFLSRMAPYKDTAIRVVTMLLLLAVGYLGGRLIEHRYVEKSVNREIGKVVRQFRPYSYLGGEFANAFLELKAREFDLEESIGADKKVGGIHANGNSLVGVTRLGKFFFMDFAKKEASLSELDIEIENNFDAFMAHARQRDLEDLRINMKFRYIDILYLEQEKRSFLLVSHHFWDKAKQCYTIRVSRLPVGGFDKLPGMSAKADDWSTLYDTAPCMSFKSGEMGHPFPGHEHGGRMALAPDGRLLLTVGDFEYNGYNDTAIVSQDPEVDYGKILKIDLETGTSELLSMGHRNVQGLLVDSRGRIWATEHGPQGGDELNLITDGTNYGWPYASNGTQYQTKTWPVALEQNRHQGYENPVYSWLPSIAVSNLIEIRDFAPEWDGDFLVTSLKQMSLYRIRYDNGRVEFAEPIVAGERIRDIDQLENGAIILWTDKAKIVELTPDTTKGAPAGTVEADVFAGLDPSTKIKAKAIIGSCARCHSTTSAGPAGGAPPLWGVYGREIASTGFAQYSRALRERDGVWNEKSLNAFLADGSAFAPDNRMAYPPIEDPELRRTVIDYLKTLN